MRGEHCRSINHPRRTMEQSRKLADAGRYPFPELTEAENDLIFQSRLAGLSVCFPSFPDSQAQARNTLAAAKQHLGID